ncbi:DUF6932 family protein [Nocardioides nanhaiensis]|uniref:Polymerase nucleotidyl transferase domain-containing protein n=1 Tax=Nocardioides nanhaiensis TaxID=1476871 RepID=A0ABP8WZW5_9ACTN
MDLSALMLNGNLLPGRWPATPQDIETYFVNGLSDRRQRIWADWLELTQALREATLDQVATAWLGGSFFTDTDEPGDIDCVYIVDWVVLLAARAHADAAQFLEVVATSQACDAFDLLVDSYILEWHPFAGVQPPQAAKDYLERRGYWDDLWSRRRSTDQREDSLPVHGYLEVTLDGFL